ncbi:unnamed protein product [Rotaria sp. Silwood1]|nr:unnamed protein product [Rotaria sp. Silwood1]
MVRIGRIDVNPYLEKQHKSLKCFYKGIKVLGDDFPSNSAKDIFAYHEHIFFAADQLNLSKLKVFNFNDKIALLYFTTKLSFRRIFQEQITDPILLSENYFNEISCKNYTADVYEYILKFFENLKHLSLIGLFPKSFPPLLLRNLPLTSTFYSSTLYKLCIYVIYYDDFLALVDGSSYNTTNVCNMVSLNFIQLFF